MPGKKDKKGERSKRSSGGGDGGGRGGGASIFGFGLGGGGLDVTDADLEAELMALEGKSPAKGGKKSSKSGMMSMDELDKVMASAGKIGGEDDDDDEEEEGDLSDMDEDELLGELKALEESSSMEVDATPPKPSPMQVPVLSPRRPLSGAGGGAAAAIPKAPSGGGAVGAVSERLELYKRAIQQAEAAGESSKVRRYKRSTTTMEQMLKSAKAGKPVNLEDLPPVISIKEPAPEAPPTKAKPHPPPPAPSKPKAPQSNLIDLDAPEFDEFNLTEEELEAMAASMVDDRVQSHAHTGPTSQSGSGTAVSQSGSRSGPDVAISHSSSGAAVSHSTSKTATPPQPKPRSPPKPKPREGGVQSKPVAQPRPKPNPPAPPMKPGGMVDLDDPMFDEFTLSEDEIAAMAAMMEESEAKKPKIDASPTSSVQAVGAASGHGQPPPQAAPRGTKTAPPPPAQPRSAKKTPPSPPQAAMKSLPATLNKPVSETSDKNSLLSLLTERRTQYLEAAKAQKNAAKNKEYRLIAAQFSRVLKAVNDGQDIDLNKMPGPPPGYKSRYNVDVAKFSSPQTAPPPKPVVPPPKGQSSEAQAAEEPDAPPNPDIPTPKTALEALEQRLAKYKEGQKGAQEKGEGSRVRRLGRIIKQYEAAIKDTKAGKPCDYNELPAPPGYPPIPAARAPAAVVLPTQSLPVRTVAQQQMAAAAALKPSISQQQKVFVEQRMTELKRAAKIEQSKSNRDGALEYLRKAKGLETMLQAAMSGLPINLEQVPPSPFAEIDKTKPSSQVMSHLRPAEEKDAATFDLIIKQLEKQIELCDKNADTYKKMGSSASAIEYENMSQNAQRELLALKGIQGEGYGPPKFSLETRTLTIIHSNAHLSSGVCEVEVTKAVNLTCPSKYEEKDLDIYVEVEFPYPVDAPPKKSTDVVHKSCSPEFSENSLMFEIDRKHHRSMARAFKRSPLKCTVWQQRSLRKDIYMGQVGVPLESLETKSEIHSTLDLLDEKGRKPVGGKLEVFVRLREPLTGRDQEEREEQWLVFKEAIAAKSAVPMPKLAPKTPPNKQGGTGTPNYSLLSPVKAEATTSVAALKFEFSLVSSAIKGGHKDGQTVQKGKMVKARIDAIQQRLQSDPNFRKAYPKQVAKEIHQEQLLEAQLAKQGKGKQAEVVILQKRRAAMEKEVREMQGR